MIDAEKGTKIKAEINVLINKVNNPTTNTMEKGYSVIKEVPAGDNGDWEFTPQLSTIFTANTVSTYMGDRNVDNLHCHTNTGTSIPSFGDVKLLRDLWSKLDAKLTKYVFVTTVVNNIDVIPNVTSVYTMKIDDFQILDNFVNAIWNDPLNQVNTTGLTQEQIDDLKLTKILKKRVCEQFKKWKSIFKSIFARIWSCRIIAL